MADKGVLLRRRPRIVVINNLFESGQNRGNTMLRDPGCKVVEEWKWMGNDFVESLESLERSIRVKMIESWSEILKFLGKKFFGALDIGGRFVLLKKRKVIHFNNRRRD